MFDLNRELEKRLYELQQGRSVPDAAEVEKTLIKSGILHRKSRRVRRIK